MQGSSRGRLLLGMEASNHVRVGVNRSPYPHFSLKKPARGRFLITAILLCAILISACAVCGCSGNETAGSESLANFINKLDFEFDQPWIVASVRGTIEKSFKEKDLTYVKVRVSRFEILPGPYQVKNPEVSPGTEIVFAAGNPKEKFPEGKKVDATLRIMKTEKGFKMFAENSLVLK